METTYFYCAAIGGGILVLQTLLMVFGLGDTDVDADLSPDMDADAGDGGSGILFQLSFKTVVAFLTFFGLVGLSCTRGGMSASWSLGLAIGAGLFAFFLVGYLMDLLISLQSQGNVRLQDAVGSSARVDLRIPANNAGCGKVRVAVSGRTVVQKAVTTGDAIPTGAEVVIQSLHGTDTFEVSLHDPQR